MGTHIMEGWRRREGRTHMDRKMEDTQRKGEDTQGEGKSRSGHTVDIEDTHVRETKGTHMTCI